MTGQGFHQKCTKKIINNESNVFTQGTLQIQSVEQLQSGLNSIIQGLEFRGLGFRV